MKPSRRTDQIPDARMPQHRNEGQKERHTATSNEQLHKTNADDREARAQKILAYLKQTARGRKMPPLGWANILGS